MNDFNYFLKTKIIFGKNRIRETGEQIAQNGFQDTLILHNNSSQKNGILDNVCLSLDHYNIRYTLIGGGYCNPSLLDACQIITELKNNQKNVEFILAIGGGSIIDLAKVIAIGMKQNGRLWDFFERKVTITDAIPIGVVLTNPASGSECSPSAVLTNPDIKVKRGCSSDKILPLFAILDPNTLLSLPDEQIACATVDIMMHTLERYLCSENDDNEITDLFAQSLLLCTMKNGKKAMKNRNDLAALSELMWCGSLSNNGITGLGKKVEFPLHQIGHQISAFYNTPHAKSLSAIWNAWACYYARKKPKRFSQLGTELFEIRSGLEMDRAKKFIEAMTEFWQSLRMPVKLSECKEDITNGDIFSLANSISNNGNRIVGNYWKMEKSDVLAILMMAK